MSLPGFGGGAVRPTVVIAANVSDVDLAALLGNPVGQIHYALIVKAGVVVSATTGNPAIDATGFSTTAVGTWYNYGEIKGHGGDGADGASDAVDGVGGGGGGGGGAGVVAGAGGAGAGPGANGGAGTATTGGSGGASSAHSNHVITGILKAGDGGDGVQLNHVVTIDNGSGKIWGGGGGGTAGQYTGVGTFGGGDGGAPGAEGGTVVLIGQYGLGGYAIRYSGSGAATFTSGGSDPNVKGSVA